MSIFQTKRADPFLAGREMGAPIVFAVAVGATLAAGFIPSANRLWIWLESIAPIRLAGFSGASFPLLAAFFYFSIRTRPLERSPVLVSPGALSFLLPCLISFAFGRFQGFPSVGKLWSSEAGRGMLFWTLLCGPLGEELLFRGWFYGILRRVWGLRSFTATNPLSVAIWMSALAFSLWHLQNIGTDSAGQVAFQVGYTFFVGLWLGALREAGGSLVAPIVVHVLLNLSSNL